MTISRTGRLAVVAVTPSIDTSIYASGDLIGDKMTFADIVSDPSRAEQGARIRAVTLSDNDAEEAAIDVILFDADPTGTTFTDNAALDIADADLDKVFGVVSLTSYASFANNSVAQSTGLDLPFVLASGSTIYAALVSRGTPTYTAATDLTLTLSAEEL